MRYVIGLVFAGLIAVVAGYFWLLSWANDGSTVSGSSPQVMVFEVLPGQSFKKIASELHSRKLVSSSQLLRVYARIDSSVGVPKVGEYELSDEMSPKEILDILESGRSRQRAVTVSEGLNLFEIADIVARQGISTREQFIAHVRNPKVIQSLLGESVETLEGYLYPETYAVTKYTKLDELVKVMVTRSLKIYDELKTQLGTTPLHFSRHQVFTLASIIEKETGAPEERPLISSVFHNRLQKGMRLQTDPTVIYGFWVQSGKMLNNIRRADLLTPHAYNTYVRSGLPPGPIANPGRESLMATFRPAQSDFLFFVSKNAGTHYFSTNLKDHENAVRQFQINPGARAGKSWRQLNQPGK